MATVLPYVHLNGTGADDLLNVRYNAVDALHAAGDALAQAGPNNRDYYPGGPEHCEAAQTQHERRLAALKGIIEGLTEEIEHIQDNRRT